MASVDTVTKALQEAAELIRCTPLHVVHATVSGPVVLEVIESGTRNWTARIAGTEVSGMHRFRSLRRANEYLLRSFAEMMPEHRCTRKCRWSQPGVDA